MIADIDHTIGKLEDVLVRLEEDVHILEVRRPWFWRIRRWLLKRERDRLVAELEELHLRRRWRVEGR